MPVAGFESARAVADAVLYEGYLLYPYRRSSGKNRVRWQFGVLAPRRWVEATGVVGTSVAGSADAWHQQTECLLQAPDPAAIHVRLRFLQLQHRSVEARDSDDPDGNYHERDMLDADGQRHLTFDEAVPREFDIAVQAGELYGDGHTATTAVPGGEDVEAHSSRWPAIGSRADHSTARRSDTSGGHRARRPPGPGDQRLWPPKSRQVARDHMLVIGDAAHATSPATGQSASMALEDAVILAKSLRDSADSASAFLLYEQLRRDRVQANINASARMSARNRPDRQHAPANHRSAGASDAINSQLEWHTRLV